MASCTVMLKICSRIYSQKCWHFLLNYVKIFFWIDCRILLNKVQTTPSFGTNSPYHNTATISNCFHSVFVMKSFSRRFTNSFLFKLNWHIFDSSENMHLCQSLAVRLEYFSQIRRRSSLFFADNSGFFDALKEGRLNSLYKRRRIDLADSCVSGGTLAFIFEDDAKGLLRQYRWMTRSHCVEVARGRPESFLD